MSCSDLKEKLTVVKERRIYSVVCVGRLKKETWYVKQKTKTGHEEILVLSVKLI